MTVTSSSNGRSDADTAPVRVVPRRFPSLAKDAALVSVRYAVEDYAFDISEHQRRLADDFVLHGNSHYRVHVNEPDAAGSYEFCGLLDGFFLMSVDSEYYTPRSVYFDSPDSLHIYLACSGDGEYVPADNQPISFEAPATVLIIEPAGTAPAEITFDGCTRYVYIILHREVLETLYGGSAHELPAALQAFLGGELSQTSGRTLALSGAMLRCLEDVHTCSLEGRLRWLFLQSKALEIVCQALEAFDQSECLRLVESSKHMPKGVLKARLFLAENFANPPCLEKLAAEVGLSRSALCTGFRQILGQSVYEYVRDLRMKQALALLSEGDDPIIQIAYAVGYNRPSSFSVAFQRHFGASPSKVRRKTSQPRT
ncbi:helix-turn-helix transcriptional regulator [Sphingomonas panacis]|uniref:helix-turn-helix transcriptional regulator n=1 Tax=Sphingomonas panacis TaxID=1560345 RepID=UPI0009F54FB8|nr:AraC family transcriptional regulator [Sphingomonas panacis]